MLLKEKVIYNIIYRYIIKMEEARESLIVNKNVKQSKCGIRTCKIIFFLICNGLSFTSGYLLNKYLKLKNEDGSL